MLELMKHGPVDWRIAEAFTLYWAAWAVEIEGTGKSFQKVNIDRMMFAAIERLYSRGTLYFRRAEDGKPPVYLMSPNFDFLDTVNDVYEGLYKKYKDQDRTVPVKDQYLNYLRDSTMTLYMYDYRKLAAKQLRRLKQEGYAKGLSLAEFVEKRQREMIEVASEDHAGAMILGMLNNSLFRVSLGEDKIAAAEESRAKAYHGAFNANRVEARQLKPYRMYRRAAMMHAMRTFQDFQVQRLRELYPKAMAEAEKKLKELEERRRKALQEQKK